LAIVFPRRQEGSGAIGGHDQAELDGLHLQIIEALSDNGEKIFLDPGAEKTIGRNQLELLRRGLSELKWRYPQSQGALRKHCRQIFFNHFPGHNN
jgi:hypothetical protein